MSYDTEVLADSPKGFWKLNEASGEPQDSSGNAMHVTTHNGTPTYHVTAPAGLGGFGMLFHSATSDYAVVPDNNILDLGDAFALEAWILRTATQGTDQAIISKLNGAYYLRISSTNHLELLDSNVAVLVASTTTITDTATWHHVVAMKNGATGKLFIDKSDVSGSFTNTTAVDNALALQIGADSGPSNFADLNMSNLAVYGSTSGMVTNTAVRVAAHYDAVAGRTRPYVDVTISN